MTNHNNLINSYLNSGRLQEAEWLIRTLPNSTYYLNELSKLLRTNKDLKTFFISPGYYGDISGWDLAESYCQNGYQASTVANAYANANANANNIEAEIDAYTIRQLCAFQQIWLNLNRPKVLKVIDFGGALGHHFHKISKHWHWSKLDWIVCETTRISSLGSKEYSNISSKGTLRFTNNIEEIIDNQTDIFFASSSIQYIRDWKYLLKKLNKIQWILLDRLPLIEEENDLLVVQVTESNYTDTRYQGWKFSKDKWHQFMNQLNISIEMSWKVPEDSYQILDINSGKFRWGAHYEFGYLFKTNSQIIF